MNEPFAVLLCGHGSREAETLREVDVLVNVLRDRLSGMRIGHGFLEFAEPTIAQGLTQLHQEGAREILVLPLTLFEGKHAQDDIPALLRDFGAAHPGLRLRYGQGFGAEETFFAIAADRVRAAAAANPAAGPESTFLLLVARGTNKAGAQDAMEKMARRLQKTFGFADALAAFSGLAAPSLAEGLAHAARSGTAQVLVVPYFLFTGRLLQEVHAKVQTAARASATRYYVAEHLFGHPLLEAALIARIRENAGDGGA